MKEIKAVIPPSRLARLREQFRKLPDFPGMTVSPPARAARVTAGEPRHLRRNQRTSETTTEITSPVTIGK